MNRDLKIEIEITQDLTEEQYSMFFDQFDSKESSTDFVGFNSVKTSDSPNVSLENTITYKEK